MTLSLSEGLRAHLVATAGITALVSTRVYPTRLPQSPTMPAIVYNEIYTSRLESMSGYSNNKTARVQIVAWASTSLAAETLRDLVAATLHGYRGALGSGGPYVAITDGGASDMPDEGEQPTIWGKRWDAMINVEETR